MSPRTSLLLAILCIISGTGKTTVKKNGIKMTTTPGVLRYNYTQILHYSLLFYEAQRSGKLPRGNRVPWRQDSCLQCKGPPRGHKFADLSGGYYTTGRSLKFTFPNAAAQTVLASGLNSYKEAYKRAGLLKRAREAVKWGADYLLQCHCNNNELVVLLGDIQELQSFEGTWIRPEDHLNKSRPFYTVSPSRPGSEVSGEVAAALAVSYIALKDWVPQQTADDYLKHAIKLYQFANKYRGTYSDLSSVPEVANFYRSWGGFKDELIWAALWLHIATKSSSYLKDAEDKYNEFRFAQREVDEFSWDDKTAGIKMLLFAATKSPKYKQESKAFCEQASDPKRLTRLGLYERNKQWGNLRYAANAAYLCLRLGELLRREDGAGNPYLNFSMKQIHYILGDAGRSYVIGLGYNWPKFVRHVGSSCRPYPEICDFTDKNSERPNPNILYGALVGGPDEHDLFTDTRHNAMQNDVGVDHNAGFQSAVAGLLLLHHKKLLPKEAYGCSYSFRYTANFKVK